MISNDVNLSRISDIMADIFDLDELEVTPTTDASDVEEWDSLSHIRLMVAIEREFGIKFSNAEIERMQNVGDLLEAVASKAGQAG